jgi:hypothetical protein
VSNRDNLRDISFFFSTEMQSNQNMNPLYRALVFKVLLLYKEHFIEYSEIELQASPINCLAKKLVYLAWIKYI